MTKRRVKESVDNLRRVVEVKDDVEIVGDMGVVMADAYAESEKNAEHVADVKDQLDDLADAVITDNPEEPKVPVDNYCTDPKADEVLKEEVEEPQKKRTRTIEDDDYDDHLDYDMFDFVTGLVSDTWPKPKVPASVKLLARKEDGSYDIDKKTGEPKEKKRMRKFRINGYDDYINNEGNVGVTEVSTNYDINAIVVNAPNEWDFDDAIAVCDAYKIPHSAVKPKRSAYSHWNYSMEIYIPMSAPDVPMMVEDYLDSIGMTLEDALPKDWCVQYREKTAKDKAGAETDLIIKKYVQDAADATMNDDLDFEVHLKNLYKKLDAAKIKYDKAAVSKMFYDEV